MLPQERLKEKNEAHFGCPFLSPSELNLNHRHEPRIIFSKNLPDIPAIAALLNYYGVQAEKDKSWGSRKRIYFISPRSLHLRPAGASLRNSLATSPCKYTVFCSAAASPGLGYRFVPASPRKYFLPNLVAQMEHRALR